eukprot:5888894-Amphidinium_carterae.1
MLPPSELALIVEFLDKACFISLCPMALNMLKPRDAKQTALQDVALVKWINVVTDGSFRNFIGELAAKPAEGHKHRVSLIGQCNAVMCRTEMYVPYQALGLHWQGTSAGSKLAPPAE